MYLEKKRVFKYKHTTNKQNQEREKKLREKQVKRKIQKEIRFSLKSENYSSLFFLQNNTCKNNFYEILFQLLKFELFHVVYKLINLQ